jgi:murein DD-endopeptidase MepM/ murein hydrolase activator NlpD
VARTPHLAGNHVVLACAGASVVLTHLQQGSVRVPAGAVVQVGDPLARVGNSGNTSQPHLHLHAERGGAAGEILTGRGVPIELDGRFLVRNSLFGGR